MNISEFRKQTRIRDYVKTNLPDMIRERLSDLNISEVYAKESDKNNGSVMLGITVVPDGQNLAPCIYVEPYIPPDPAAFEQEGVWEKIADRLSADFRYALDAIEPNPEELYLLKDIPERLVLKAVNHDRNEKILSMYPHRDVLNLSVLLEWEVTCGGRVGYIHVSEEILTLWGKTFDEMYDIALENTMRKYPERIEPLEDVLKDFLGECAFGLAGSAGSVPREKSPCFKSPFYYLGTTRALQGVVVLLYPGILKKAYEIVGEPFFVIPSSINELLILPCSYEPDHKHLDNLVWEVNTYVLDREEVLSDELYVYDPEEDTLKVI